MPTDDPLAVDAAQEAVDIVTQQIILSASRHEIATLRGLLRDASSAAPANVRDPETGHTPLHAAIEGAADDDDDADADGADEDPESAGGRAARTVQLLLQNGAIWNALDRADETPGCLAWRLGRLRLYELIVDAGVRTELLFQRLDGYEPLNGGEESDEDEDEDEKEGEDGGDGETTAVATAAPTTKTTTEAEGEGDGKGGDDSLQNANFLSSRLTFTSTRLLDASNNAVMMGWERDIMARSVRRLLPTSKDDGELAVLNIGHGMGIVDAEFQAHSPWPTAHHIVEAHADVAAAARAAPDGFAARHAGVTLHEGRWQEVLPRLAAEGLTFDAIYFDTFAEPYADFRAFFEEFVIMLLKEGGRWGFFHGLGADRRVCYDVYTKVVEMDLFEAGFDVEWEKVAVPDLEKRGEWEGVRRSYWELDEYRLPTCTFLG